MNHYGMVQYMALMILENMYPGDKQIQHGLMLEWVIQMVLLEE